MKRILNKESRAAIELMIANNLITKDVAKKYFPELKESEDEKIRKVLIIGFNKFNKNSIWYNGITNSQILAWLEKQGEHANFRNKIQIGDKVTRNEDGVLVNLSQLNRVAKPAYKVEPKFKVGDTVKDPYGDLYHIAEITDDSYKTNDGRFILFKNQELYTLSNFTAWSEEDERIIKNIIYDIDYLKKECCSDHYEGSRDRNPYHYSELINWLKDLKERVQSQNLTITDEELINARNEAYNDALNKIEYSSDTPTFNDGWSAAIWYLKKNKII